MDNSKNDVDNSKNNGRIILSIMIVITSLFIIAYGEIVNTFIEMNEQFQGETEMIDISTE